MRISNNLAALGAFNALAKTNSSLDKVVRALSTGLRINSAADDAAGFAVSEKMRSQISGLHTAFRNTEDGVSMLQVAEGGLGGINSMLQRMRELAVQASNDSLTSQDRQYIQLEVDELKDQIDRIAQTTQFNKKRILDGSSGALWSSSDFKVKALIHGGLQGAEGNYRIEVVSDPGQAEVQKSHIYDIQELNQVVGYSNEYWELNIVDKVDSAGGTEGEGWNFSNDTLNITADGTYYVVGNLDDQGNPVQTSTAVRVASGVKASIVMRDIYLVTNGFGFDCTGADVDLWIDGNNNVIKGGQSGGHCSAIEVPVGSKLKISSMAGDYSTTGQLTVTGTVHGAGIGGSCAGGADCGDITILGGTIIATGGQYAAGIGGGSASGTTAGNSGTITILGGNVTATGGTGAAGIGSATDLSYGNETRVMTGTINIGGTAVVNAAGSSGTFTDNRVQTSPPTTVTLSGSGIGAGAGCSSSGMSINIDPSATVTASGYVPIGSGERSDDDTTYTTNAITVPTARTAPNRPSWNRPIYDEVHRLSDIKQFYNSEGVFLVERPQKITITQGDGQKAEVTLYATDSLYDVAEKINKAIADQLGQARYADNREHFCTVSKGTEGTSESIFESEPIYNTTYNEDGTIKSQELIGHNIHTTMLVRSVIPGKSGELSFAGDDEILRALGLNTIQSSSETKFTSSIYDAHSGKSILTGMKSTGNIIHGAFSGVDIEFDAMAATTSTWDDDTKRYVTASGEKYSAVIHLSDRTTTFQTGANRGEDFTINLGDMSSHALGITGVNLASRETAARSIGTIDRAINSVSSQRAKIGAYINGLEHTMENLTSTTANLTAAESRIRDADMSKTMMEFVKLQILNQSGTSMLAQANQLPQSVMSLMQ